MFLRNIVRHVLIREPMNLINWCLHQFFQKRYGFQMEKTLQSNWKRFWADKLHQSLKANWAANLEKSETRVVPCHSIDITVLWRFAVFVPSLKVLWDLLQ